MRYHHNIFQPNHFVNQQLFDTPGVLWPKFESEDIARNIALIGSIKQQILPREDLFIFAVEYLVKNYPGTL